MEACRGSRRAVELGEKLEPGERICGSSGDILDTGRGGTERYRAGKNQEVRPN